MLDGILTPCNVARSWHWFGQMTAPCSVIRGSGMTCHWNSPSGSTLQCDTYLWNHDIEFASALQCGRWIWDDMPLNSPKRPPYWNYTSGFDFDHITAVDMSFCTSLRNFVQIGPPTSCRFSRWRSSAILHFRRSIMGSLKSPCMTSYRSSMDTTALNCLVFLIKSRF